MDCSIKTVLEDYRHGKCSMEEAHGAMHRIVDMMTSSSEDSIAKRRSGLLPDDFPPELAEFMAEIGLELIGIVPCGTEKEPEGKKGPFSFVVNHDDHKVYITGPLAFEIDFPPNNPSLVKLVKYAVHSLNLSWDIEKGVKIAEKSRQKDSKNGK